MKTMNLIKLKLVYITLVVLQVRFVTSETDKGLPMINNTILNPRIFLLHSNTEKNIDKNKILVTSVNPNTSETERKLQYDIQTPIMIPIAGNAPLEPYPKAITTTKTLQQVKSQQMQFSIMNVFRKMTSFVSYLWSLWTGPPARQIEGRDYKEKYKQKYKKKYKGGGGGGGGGKYKHKNKIKIKTKYKKMMLPLLMAYKLKFLAMIPLMIGGLVLLAKAAGMAGFFFAMFAAAVGLKVKGHNVAH